MSALDDLARAAGLQRHWEDAANRPQRVADEVLVAVLDRLGFPAGSAAEIADSRERLARHAQPDFLTADVGRPVVLPRSFASGQAAELQLEDGSRQQVAISAMAAGPTIPAIAVPGYHRLEAGARVLDLAVAPQRCFGIADAVGDQRIWGPAVQIPSLRGQRGTAFGDLGTLAEAAAAFARSGADALALSPVHALFPADPARFSPYAPSSRDYLNVLLGHPALAGLPAEQEDAGDLIDWQQAIPRRMALLRRAYDQRSDAVRENVAAYREAGGPGLEGHARFDALHAHFFERTGATGWRGWPAEFHDPASDAVARFATDHADAVDFYAFLQWLAARGLEVAQHSARDGGMGIGLIGDLAVGMDGGGSHGWSRRGDLLQGLSVGAPPDLLGPDGQNWGITGFSPHALSAGHFAPFVATLRATMQRTGGIRIDHALGLRRLWVIPEGGSAAEGVYLTMPMDDLFRLLALESQRHRAIVIGEDLGTIPPGLREAMDARGMPGMRVLWFERDGDGGFVPPRRWSPEAAAMTGTHDLATVAGWWCGHDVARNWQLGRTSRAASEAEEQAERADERDALWRAAQESGAACGPQPAPDQPAAAVDAALDFIAATPCRLALVPLEDLAGLVEQPNLPGTTDEHPNWRRRMPATAEEMLEDPPVARRVDRLSARSASERQP